MMQSLLGQKRTLSVYAAEHNLPATLTVNQWGLMERAVEILAPFEELTRAVSAETATTADVIPAIAALKRVLSREQATDEGVKTMKRTLLEAVERRFSHVESDPLYSVASLVDPRYKDRYFADPNSLGPAKDALIREVEKMEELKKASSDVPEEQQSSKKPRLSTDTSLGSVFEEILQESEQERRSVTSSSVLVQVQTYLTEQTIVRSANPLTYWRDNAARFPSLVGIAQRYLSAPCTSVDSERFFSAVSNIMDEKRNRLSADRVEKLVFLNKNLHFTLK
ncbi:zinc finger BED domain-containing protein 4-like [Fundulus heteroclitus]|uniref:zinc finger BED domain-containing protein 4-like n=1 Tax=Fundulus heteroclitus TaxID=8078 RepID=UPI00165B5445|nr:zinc finger BED domain-containing protein 4-like [Fundulus heteroclitus]